ncbi:hypothetical protein V2I01_33805 [Micromonospora sp. BRA006-A]|nr:hypothetical protein [Micromonospora sp. BRA006-A]
MLGAHPHLRGTLVDRDEPVATAAATFAACGLAGRAETVVGTSSPRCRPAPTCTWSPRAHRLERRPRHRDPAALRRGAGTTGRVLVIEVLPTMPHVPHLSPYDLRMLVLVGGRERGVPEFAALAAAAGLAPRRTYHGTDGLTLMEFAAGA